MDTSLCYRRGSRSASSQAVVTAALLLLEYHNFRSNGVIISKQKTPFILFITELVVDFEFSYTLPAIVLDTG